MSSNQPDTRRRGDPSGHIGVIDTRALAEAWPRRVVTGLVVLGVMAVANGLVPSEILWRVVRDSHAAQYADYHAVALQMPNNLAPPPWVRGGAALMGASNVGVGLPQELSADLFGERLWTLWAPGVNPPELLALAPQAVRAGVQRVIVAVEVQYMSTGADTPFSRDNRDAYTGLWNPAWRYRWELSGGDWREVGRALPLIRVREPLHVLLEGYVAGRVIEKRLPGQAAWREAEAAYNQGPVQAALVRWRADPTVEHYQAYQDTVSMNHAGMLEFWAGMRRVQIDTAGQAPNVRALRALTAYLRAHDIAVAWALFPENAMYGVLPGLDDQPVAPADIVPAAREMLARLAEQDHVPYRDLWDLCPPDEFLDLFHVTPPARQKLADALRPLLDELQTPPDLPDH